MSETSNLVDINIFEFDGEEWHILRVEQHQIYIYNWGNNEKRKTMKGRECWVEARGGKNSCVIQFLDNLQKECVSRNSLRKKK